MTPPCRVVRPKVSPPPRPTTTRNSTVTGVTAPFTRMTPSCLRNPTRSRPSPVCTLACFPPCLPTSHQKSTFACLHPCKACFLPQCLPTSHPLLPPEVDLRLSAPKVAC